MSYNYVYQGWFFMTRYFARSACRMSRINNLFASAQIPVLIMSNFTDLGNVRVILIELCFLASYFNRVIRGTTGHYLWKRSTLYVPAAYCTACVSVFCRLQYCTIDYILAVIGPTPQRKWWRKQVFLDYCWHPKLKLSLSYIELILGSLPGHRDFKKTQVNAA